MPGQFRPIVVSFARISDAADMSIAWTRGRQLSILFEICWSQLCRRAPRFHDDVIKWKHFPRYWPFVRGIQRSPLNSRKKASDAELWCVLLSAPGSDRVNKSWGWWFETPSGPLWRHINVHDWSWKILWLGDIRMRLRLRLLYATWKYIKIILWSLHCPYYSKGYLYWQSSYK